ncbi:ead/Ea22-like family protein [Enterobacter cloacae]|uniref:ead/Ea22-like family protein n=1 Tax=Enterobacter cloacae TaxID=550 RepID=UPI002003282F|nr:ead/Ea22-like family protein [Enterobacter cloacae]MCK7221010.1 ead/Ea22-like family protein [Enterobacter cloacae]
MSNIDKRALREAAEKASTDNHTQDEWFHYLGCSRPATVLALLDELENYKSRETRVTKLVLDNQTSWDVLCEKLEAAEKRIAELEAREVKLPELKMLRDYLAEVTMREREDILVGVRLEFFRALEEAGVKVAAAGKGE